MLIEYREGVLLCTLSYIVSRGCVSRVSKGGVDREYERECYLFSFRISRRQFLQCAGFAVMKVHKGQGRPTTLGIRPPKHGFEHTTKAIACGGCRLGSTTPTCSYSREKDEGWRGRVRKV